MRSRRQFIGETSCAAIGSTSVISTLLNLTMANHAAAQGGMGDQRKALVCLFLAGGCDTFNLLIPRDSSGGYDEYAASRAAMAIPQADLIPLNFTDSLGRNFGLHPSCPRLAEMFNGMAGDVTKKRVSLMANIGTLVEPIPNKQAYLSGNVGIPKALFSHRDQTEQWQTSVPQGMQILTGWGGRAADVIHTAMNTEQTAGYYMPMNFSLAGNSAFQIGQSQGQFVITSGGALSFTGASNSSAVHLAKQQALRSVVASPVEDHYQNLFQRTHAKITSDSIDRGTLFQASFDSPGTVNNLNLDTVLAGAGFPNHWLSDQFKAAVKTIAIRESLKLKRQTIFIEYGGWDHHAELLVNQQKMLLILDGVLYAFQKSLELLGLAQDVVTFTCSDFGRTLRTNGQGTDHAWAGNQLVMGAPVTGGVIRGKFPSLVLDGADDIGRGGRLFPSLSADVYFCELLRWFGVTAGDMDRVLPNIRKFYDPASATGPVGFIS